MTSLKTLTFTVSGRPVPFMRHVGQGRRAYNPPKYTAWRQEVTLAARLVMAATDFEMFTGDLLLLVEARIPNKKLPDTDNLGKGVADALEGEVYKNDKANCITFTSRTIDPDNPGVTVYVAELGEGQQARIVEKVRGEIC